MTNEEIECLMGLMQRHGIAAFEFSEGGTHISLYRQSAEPTHKGSSSGTADNTGAEIIRSPGIGRLRLRHPALPGQAPGWPRKVRKGEAVAWLAVGPMLRPVLADRDCTLGQALAPEGAIIGYGDPLFSV